MIAAKKFQKQVKPVEFTFLENGTISSPCFSMLGFAALGILEKSPPCNRAECLVAEEGLEPPTPGL